MLSKVSVGSKCLNLERIPNDFLILEEINNICCFQVRFGSKNTKVFNAVTPLKKNFYHGKTVLWLCRSSFVSGMTALQNLIFFGVKKIIFLSLANYIHWQVLY